MPRRTATAAEQPQHSNRSRATAAEQQQQLPTTMACHYSILDLDDNTEYGTASIPAIEDEKIHEFGSRVLVANGFEERAAVVFQFGDVTAKACPRANEVASFFGSSGSKEKPFLVHLKKQQHQHGKLLCCFCILVFKMLLRILSFYCFPQLSSRLSENARKLTTLCSRTIDSVSQKFLSCVKHLSEGVMYKIKL
jgi:hypothetical protein